MCEPFFQLPVIDLPTKSTPTQGEYIRHVTKKYAHLVESSDQDLNIANQLPTLNRLFSQGLKFHAYALIGLLNDWSAQQVKLHNDEHNLFIISEMQSDFDFYEFKSGDFACVRNMQDNCVYRLSHLSNNIAVLPTLREIILENLNYIENTSEMAKYESENLPRLTPQVSKDELYEFLAASLFRELGSKAKLSKSGKELLFHDALDNKTDHSAPYDPALFMSKLSAAGIDYKTTTAHDIENYQRWKRDPAKFSAGFNDALAF